MASSAGRPDVGNCQAAALVLHFGPSDSPLATHPNSPMTPIAVSDCLIARKRTSKAVLKLPVPPLSALDFGRLLRPDCRCAGATNLAPARSLRLAGLDTQAENFWQQARPKPASAHRRAIRMTPTDSGSYRRTWIIRRLPSGSEASSLSSAPGKY